MERFKNALHHFKGNCNLCEITQAQDSRKLQSIVFPLLAQINEQQQQWWITLQFIRASDTDCMYATPFLWSVDTLLTFYKYGTVGPCKRILAILDVPNRIHARH